MPAPVAEIVAGARRLADVLEEHSLPYALGGAIAYGYWGAPRGTLDIDINVFIEPERIDELLPVLGETGCTMDEEAARRSALARGDFKVWLGPIRVDVFLLSVPFLEQVKQRRVVRPLAGRPAWVLSAEDITTLKMMFFRAKDLVDVERMIARQADDLDQAAIRANLVSMVGEDNERVDKWDELVLRFCKI